MSDSASNRRELPEGAALLLGHPVHDPQMPPTAGDSPENGWLSGSSEYPAIAIDPDDGLAGNVNVGFAVHAMHRYCGQYASRSVYSTALRLWQFYSALSKEERLGALRRTAGATKAGEHSEAAAVHPREVDTGRRAL